MATVRAREGRVFIDFRYLGVRCRERTVLEDKPENIKRAKLIADRIEAEITLGSFDYAKYFPKSKKVAKFSAHNQELEKIRSGLPDFTEFAELWLSESEVLWRIGYRKNIRIILDKHLLKWFGDKGVAAITKADILGFRVNLSRLPRAVGNGLSPATINKIMMVLRQILEEAADRFDFQAPTKGIKALKVPKTHIQPFSLGEVWLILSKVRPDFRNYFTVRFFTGMRTGEIDGLQWKFVDFERKEILIRETWTGGRMEYTKTDGSQREIKMSAPVLEALQKQRQKTGGGRYVFCTANGNPYNNRNVTQRVWYPILANLEIERRRPYQTRHTAATLWMAAGENPEWIARQMGHVSTEMLFTIYSRYVPNLTRNDGSAFEQLLAEKTKLEQE